MKILPNRFRAWYLTLIFITALLMACGGAAKSKDKISSAGDDIDHKTLMTQHRAFDHFSKGDLYERSGNLDKAADEYRLALFYDPKSAELKRSLARVLYDLTRYDESLDIALQIENPDMDDQLLMAACYNNMRMVDKAIEIYETIAESDSAPQFVIENLAEYYTIKKDRSKVQKYYDWLIENGNNERLWRSEMASAFVKMEKPDEAARIYQEMIRSDSLDYGAYLGLAAVRIYEDKFDEADSIYSFVALKNWDNAQMLSMILPAILDMNDVDMSLRIARRITVLYPEDYMALRRYAILLFTTGDLIGADSVFVEIVKSVEDDPVSNYYRGRIAQQNGDYARAESLYIKTVAYADTMPEGWVNLAFVRGLLENHEGAVATFDSAFVFCPADSTQILFYTGVYFGRRLDYDRAIEYYERVLNARPDDSDVKFNLAAAYERTGRYDDAERLFLDLIEINENNAVVLNYLGYMYADLGIKLDEAEKMIKKALEISPDNGAYLDSYAWVMYKKGKYKKALEYQIRALEASEEDAILFEHMGDIYFALNDTQKANYHWEKALELDPDNQSIQEKLEK